MTNSSCKKSFHVIIGPMFSGKTTELLRLFNRALIAKRKTILIKYSNDNRYNKTYIVTHDKSMSAKAMNCIKLNDLKEYIIMEKVEDIFIDELQFYEDNVSFCEDMINNNGCTVTASMLSGTFQRKQFSTNAGELLSKAETITQLDSICGLCHRDGASYTMRLNDNKDEVVIGGDDMYVAVCRDCFKISGQNE